MLERLNAIDTKLFLWLNNHHSPFMDKLMWFISGKEEWIPLYLIIIGYIVYKYRWKSIYVFIAVGLFVTLADQISTSVFKDGFKRLRPSHVEELKGMVHHVNDYYGGLYGFVSSHAANSFAMAAFTSLLFQKRWYTISIFIWASVVSYSRIYLGVHYPGDIIAGALLGYVIGYGVFKLYAYISIRFLTKKST